MLRGFVSSLLELQKTETPEGDRNYVDSLATFAMFFVIKLPRQPRSTIGTTQRCPPRNLMSIESAKLELRASANVNAANQTADKVGIPDEGWGD